MSIRGEESDVAQARARAVAERAGPWRALVDRQRLRLAGIRDLPARTALRIANLPQVRPALARRYARALADHAPELPPISAEDRALIDALDRDGVYVTTLDRLGLGGGARLLAGAAELAGQFAVEARRLAAAGRGLTIVPPSRVAQRPFLYRWGLCDRLLAIVENYLGVAPAYEGVTINYTVADGREVSTRKWHRDWEDRRMLKVAVYLNDVGEGGGPMQVIRRTTAGQDDRAGFTYHQASDAEIGNFVGDDHVRDLVSCTGPAGTVIFVDTARFFHRGQPAVSHDRAALFFSYVSARPRHPFFCGRTGLSRREIADLASGLADRARRAALWRRELPWWVRLIPSAQL